MAKIPRGWLLCSVLLLALGAVGSLPGPRYLLQQGRGQLELMAGRVPLEEALRTVELTEQEAASLREVPGIKAFGEREIGLSPTRNYETVNPTFDRVVWNVSGVSPLRFVSHLYRYPVVGALPYIGFFDRDAAERERQTLEGLGWEVHVRAAGAYSTLGWFRDPLWRSMLRWDRGRLANTILHELAHATVWIKGRGGFNESWAGFVGDEASRRYLLEHRRDDPAAWRLLQDREHDGARYKVFMHALVTRLEGLYGSGMSRAEILARKARVLDEARAEYRRLPWRLEGYRRALDGPLDNATLVQFRVYNTRREVFEAALRRFGGDLGAFVAASRDLPRQRRQQGRGFDPYAAVAELRPPG